ncbi:hypothetical protein Syun_009733 [Stephania yunnanensis]|uniref:Uncharacterized protein n=1 Tax=Stephania yunnanensis TaxID=152371 RepID=A0AAP0KH90_9MAGN
MAVKKQKLQLSIQHLDRSEAAGEGNRDTCTIRKLLKDEIEVILAEQQISHQKLKTKWLKEGGSNTKFFHRILLARGPRTQSNGLMTRMARQWPLMQGLQNWLRLSTGIFILHWLQ